jgi:hypothetical protein
MPSARGIRVAAPLLVALLGLGARVDAQVDCSNADNLCTGDPCVIPSVEVAFPCIVDFGPRTVVVAGTLRVGDGVGPLPQLSLTAAAIEVPGGIRGAGETFGVREVVLTLSAAEDIVVTGRIVTHKATLIAGGDITLEGRVSVKGFNGAGSTFDAGGVLRVMRPVRSEGSTTLRGAGGVQLLGSGSVNTTFRGNIEISSAAGEVTIGAPLKGLDIVIDAAGSVVLSKRIVGVDILDVSSASGDITVTAPIYIYPGFVHVSGRLAAVGTVRIDRKIFLAGSGLRIEGSAVQVGRAATLTSLSPLRLVATGGDLMLAGRFLAPGGGVIEGTASGDVTATGDFIATPNGCISLAAGGTLDTSGGTFNPPLSVDCPGSPSGAFLEDEPSLGG